MINVTAQFPTSSDLGYYSLREYLIDRYGCRVHKVSLHAGMTCPNRDGKSGIGGCTYCVNESFNPQARDGIPEISEQMRDGIAYMRRRYNAKKFIAYFQAFTNTYASCDVLRARYDDALAFDNVVGLSVGTRPDCVPDDVLDMLQSYTDENEVWVEYGLQSSHDKTLQRINRGHDYATFLDAIERTRGRGIKVCVHMILGLPGESESDMMESAERLAELDIDGLKLHHLYISRGTQMEKEYLAGDVPLLEAEDYVRIACDFLERTPPTVNVQRLVGDTTCNGVTLAPQWPYSKARVLQMFPKEFGKRGTSQGCFFVKK